METLALSLPIHYRKVTQSNNSRIFLTITMKWGKVKVDLPNASHIRLWLLACWRSIPSESNSSVKNSLIESFINVESAKLHRVSVVCHVLPLFEQQ